MQQGLASTPADGGTPRNLMGFKDGSASPAADDRETEHLNDTHHLHSSHPYDAGLLFAAYQADPQEKMAASDRLMEFIVAEGGAIFAVPPGAAEGGYVGEGLFES